LRESHRGARILLAEDNPINTEVVQQILHAAGLDVSVAENGRVALDKAGTETYDLILMDMQMPELDGIEATQAIRCLPAYAKTPILALTANAFAEDRRACLESGMNDVLTKPVEPAQLYEALVRWLPAGSGTGSAATTEKTSTTLPDTSLDVLRAFPGIDVDQGLIFMNGRVDRYLTLLRQFALTHDNDMMTIDGHLARGERIAAQHIIHTLKGAAGTLGLVTIARIAKGMDGRLKEEHALVEHGEWLRQAFVELKIAWHDLIRVLPAAIPEAGTTSPAPTIDPALVRDALKTLEDLLEQHDLAVLAHFKENSTVFRSALGASYPELERQIKRFDFGPAITTLRGWRKGK